MRNAWKVYLDLINLEEEIDWLVLIWIYLNQQLNQ